MKNKILFVLCLLFGLMFINAGLNKFFNYMPAPTDLPPSMMKVMKAFMDISWLMPLVGVAEVIGGILFIIPKYRALGAIIVFPVMIGILLTNIFDAPSGLPIALVLLAVNLWALFENRAKYMPMVTNLNH
jgi:putative oxidoreductase